MSDAKRWIGAAELLQDAWRLARCVIDSGYAPTLLIGLWRGGAPIAVAVHEALAWRGQRCEHLPLRTTLYSGIDERAPGVRIHGLAALRALDCLRTAELRVATVWWKPTRNRSTLTPDYWIHQTADWLVFPHELCGLEPDEVRAHRPEASVLLD